MPTETTEPQPFWTIEITLDNEVDYHRVYDEIGRVLFNMGEVGHLAGQKWIGIQPTAKISGESAESHD